MQGVGNDFLIFEQGEVAGVNLPELARRACDRHFGVGADGILVPASSGVAAHVASLPQDPSSLVAVAAGLVLR